MRVYASDVRVTAIDDDELEDQHVVRMDLDVFQAATGRQGTAWWLQSLFSLAQHKHTKMPAPHANTRTHMHAASPISTHVHTCTGGFVYDLREDRNDGEQLLVLSGCARRGVGAWDLPPLPGREGPALRTPPHPAQPLRPAHPEQPRKTRGMFDTPPL